MLAFEEARLARRVASLSDQHQLAFIASFCERLVPNYAAFCIAEGWGNRALVEASLDQIWDHLEGAPLSPEYSEKLVQRPEEVAPDSDDFAFILTEAAQEAVGCVIYALQFCIAPDPELAVQAARAVRNALDQYLCGANVAYLMPHRPERLQRLFLQNPTLELEEEQRLLREFYAWIETTPLMQAELVKQQEDLAFLEATPFLDQQALKQLHKSSMGCGLRPLERGLVPGEEARRLLKQETKRP